MIVDVDKLPIVEKAWHVYHDDMVKKAAEYYYSVEDTPIVYAETVNKAKSKASEPYNWSIDDREPTYLDLKVKRARNYDKISYAGEIMSRNKAKRELKKIKRFLKLLNLPENDYFYVQDRRNYVGNAVLWWAKDGKGYTTDLTKAHKYTKDEIISDFTDSRETDIIWIGSHVEKAIRSYVDAQYLDYKQSIQ
jgi:hypothetical protein